MGASALTARYFRYLQQFWRSLTSHREDPFVFCGAAQFSIFAGISGEFRFRYLRQESSVLKIHIYGGPVDFLCLVS